MRHIKSLRLSGALAAAALAVGLTATPDSASAQPMYLGEIFAVGFNFCPRTSAALDGQILPISQNQALFSLLGTMYGGDGRTSFALPDMRGRVAFGHGQGAGLSNHNQGAKSGGTQTSVTISQMASHNHAIGSVNQTGDKGGPASDFFAKSSDGAKLYHNGPADALFDPTMMQHTGGAQALNITQPYLAVNWCIIISGLFPSRN